MPIEDVPGSFGFWLTRASVDELKQGRVEAMNAHELLVCWPVVIEIDRELERRRSAEKLKK